MKRKYLIEYKELMDEWDYIKNDILHFDPTNITYGSGIKANWICSECGYNWQAVVRNRIRGQGCPKCAIKKISVKKIIPKGDKLSITHPELSKEWFFERNTEYDFYNISTFSNQKVWWKCKNGHVWDEIISNRTRRNSECPYCSNHRILKGYNDLSTTAPHLAVQWNYERNKDIDIYSISSYSNIKVWWKCKNNHEWQSSPSNRMRGFGCPVCKNKKQVSIPEKTIVYYLRQFFIVEEQKKFIWLGRKDIDIFLPELNLAIEYDGEIWHKNTIKDLEKEILLVKHGVSLIRIREPNCPKYEGNCKCIITDNPKNKFFLRNTLDKLMLYINKQYDLNHSFCYDYENDYLKIYELVVTERENNNLQLLFPTVANEWNFARNGNLRPIMFAPGSNATVWWKCEKGHEWQASIVDRTLGEHGCPFCSNQRLLKGYNDLETTYPLLVKEWNFEKNLNLKPCDLTFGTAKIVWWKCKKGHEWQASVVSRTKVGNKCPICSNRIVLKGYNDLESQYPNLIKEWDYDKNIVDPCEISYHYDNKVYWICNKGHSYEASVYSRVKKKTNCPVCANQKIISGYNDLKTKNPLLTSEWDYEKNIILPDQVAQQSNVKYWWKCEKGHSYQASPSNRHKGRGCPYCSNRRVLVGYNDLATVYPDMILEWDYEKNIDVSPTEVTSHSGQKVYWKCSLGHSWKTSIRDRTTGGTNCPYCYKLKRGIKIE